MVNVEEGKIKEIVKEHYGDLARGATSQLPQATDCCGANACCETALYSAEEVETLPTEAVQASAGCGNPTALASLNEGETVVDFGSGGGIDCFLAAQQVGSGGRVIGIDMTPDMIDLANKNRDKLGLSNVEFHLADMENTPLEDETSDVIISNCVITLAPDKDAVFREAYRILRPGGRMYISDMVLSEALPTRHPVRHVPVGRLRQRRRPEGAISGPPGVRRIRRSQGHERHPVRRLPSRNPGHGLHSRKGPNRSHSRSTFSG